MDNLSARGLNQPNDKSLVYSEKDWSVKMRNFSKKIPIILLVLGLLIVVIIFIYVGMTKLREDEIQKVAKEQEKQLIEKDINKTIENEKLNTDMRGNSYGIGKIKTIDSQSGLSTVVFGNTEQKVQITDKTILREIPWIVKDSKMTSDKITVNKISISRFNNGDYVNILGRLENNVLVAEAIIRYQQ